MQNVFLFLSVGLVAINLILMEFMQNTIEKEERIKIAVLTEQNQKNRIADYQDREEIYERQRRKMHDYKNQLSNLLDNAIRESEKVLKNTGKAVIHLKLECEDHKLIFAVRNPVTEKVEIENDTIKSKRGDHHGIGLLNVKAVVDKYGGDMVLSCDENEFKAVVIL